MLAQTILTLGALGIFKHLPERRLTNVEISVAFEVPGVHFLMCRTCHELASCCKQRIIPASNAVICDRMSAGIVLSRLG